MTDNNTEREALLTIANEMIGAADYLAENPDAATDAVMAEAFRAYAHRMRTVQRPNND